MQCTVATQAPLVNLTFGNCAPVNVCTGSLPGTWHYTAGCANSAFPEIRQLCPTATFSSQAGTVRGCVNFTGTTVERHVTLTASATANVSSCAMGVPCSFIQNVAQMYLPGTTCTAGAGGSCDCTASRTTNINEVGPYTNNAGVVTVDGGVYDTCVNPSTTLTYNRRDGGIEEGNYTLTRQ